MSVSAIATQQNAVSLKRWPRCCFHLLRRVAERPRLTTSREQRGWISLGCKPYYNGGAPIVMDLSAGRVKVRCS